MAMRLPLIEPCLAGTMNWLFEFATSEPFLRNQKSTSRSEVSVFLSWIEASIV